MTVQGGGLTLTKHIWICNELWHNLLVIILLYNTLMSYSFLLKEVLSNNINCKITWSVWKMFIHNCLSRCSWYCIPVVDIHPEEGGDGGEGRTADPITKNRDWQRDGILGVFYNCHNTYSKLYYVVKAKLNLIYATGQCIHKYSSYFSFRICIGHFYLLIIFQSKTGFVAVHRVNSLHAWNV